MIAGVATSTIVKMSYPVVLVYSHRQDVRERIMTVTHTLRKQNRSVFRYLHHACANLLYDNPPASLLPSPA